MEQLLHYVWKHKLFPLSQLQTTAGKPVEVIDTGLHNHHAGPDFFNAKLRIGGTLWIGNVEIHERSSDWYQHGHHRDAAYNNVILHVTGTDDSDVVTESGKQLPQMLLAVPETVSEHYRELLEVDNYPPCYQIIPHLSSLMLHAWMNALQTERLEQKTQAINSRVKACNGDWEAAYFVTLARNYGFGINGEAFETWARSIPLHAVDHHRDDLFQIEAFFLGQAGLLEPTAVARQHRDAAVAEGYLTRLQAEYRFLANKFKLQPMDAGQWRFLRLRPQNFPHIRIAQLANLYFNRQASLSALIDCTTVEQAQHILHTKATPYWQDHYAFGSPSRHSEKHLSAASLHLLMINTVVPMLFAYGRYKGDERLCDRAFDFLEQLKAEDNSIVREWRGAGLQVKTAGDSQALVQLKRNYCERKDCLRCRIGYEYLASSFKKQRGNGGIPPAIALLAEEEPSS